LAVVRRLCTPASRSFAVDLAVALTAVRV
jgi:hypothetical protein